MNEEEMLVQLYDLINDRNSFIIEDENNNCEIFKKDKQALETIIKNYKHDKLCLSGYRENILKQCDGSLTRLSVFEETMKENQELQSRIDNAIEYIEKDGVLGTSSDGNEYMLKYDYVGKEILSILKGN